MRRSVGSDEKMDSQKPGDRPDLTFIYRGNEIGCVELGLADHGPKGTKKLNEASTKVPLFLKSFHNRICEQYNTSANGIVIPGFIISGMHIVGLVMTFNKGSVSLVSRFKRMKMPEAVEKIPRLLPPVLKLVYNASQLMKTTVGFIKDTSSSVSLDKPDVPSSNSYNSTVG